jgi:hypothetical protein
MARWTIPFSSYAPDAMSSLDSGSPKSMTPPIPSACTSTHSPTSWSMDIW